jgi:hypothetical protein
MIMEFDMDLLRRLSQVYLKSKKKEKSKLLTQYQDLTGVSRQTAIKRFNRFLRKPTNSLEKIKRKKKTGRKKKFKSSHREIIYRCYRLAGEVCAEKIYPMLPMYIDQLKSNGLLKEFNLETIKETVSVSLGTLKRIISTFPKTSQGRAKGNSLIHQKIPIIADFGKYAFQRPGYIEVDFVEHNGGRSDGVFAITGVYVDLYSQWTVRAAGLGKNIESVSKLDSIAHTRIPFRIFHYHPDNDKTILKVLFDKIRNQQRRVIRLSRSRPYKKNDNAYVEQKGGDKVRKLIGYLRFDSPEEVELLNEIYKRADLIDNFFIACAKLKKKLKDKKGRTIKKIYEQPKTPYQRLMENKSIPQSVKDELSNTMKKLNMVKLRQEIDELIEKLMKIKIEKSKYKNFKDKNYDLTSIKK